MQNRYRWRDGTRVKGVSASAAADRINAIRAKLKRDVRPQDILADARSPKSPLHHAFEWSNTKAAEKWRLHQASYLLVSIEVVPCNNQGKAMHEGCRAFVRVQRDQSKPAYAPIAESMNDPVIRDQILAIAKDEAKMWAARYRRFVEFAEVVAAIDRRLAG